MKIQPKLVLASTSPYRAALLAQLGLDFEQVDPIMKESAKAGEMPEALARRLAREKANAGASRYRANGNGPATSLTSGIASTSPSETGNGMPDKGSSHSCLVIGSDQVAHLETTIFHKPGAYDAAFQQLEQSRGKWVSFCSAICLVDEAGGVIAEGADNYEIKYRNLTDSEIHRYLSIEQPFDCAGSIKAEGRGIALIAETRGRDINTLYGLPLILLVDLLNQAGFKTIEHFK